MKLLKQAKNNQQQEAKEIKHQTHVMIEKTSSMPLYFMVAKKKTSDWPLS